MLTPGGVKLLDFGLAKLRDPEPDPNLPASTQSGLHSEDGAVAGHVSVHGAGAGRRWPCRWPRGHLCAGRRDVRDGVGNASIRRADACRSGRRHSHAQPASLSSVCSAVPPALDRIVDNAWRRIRKGAGRRRATSRRSCGGSREDVEGRPPRSTRPPRDHRNGTGAWRGQEWSASPGCSLAPSRCGSLIASGLVRRTTPHSAIHAADVSCGHDPRSPIRSGRRNDHLQRGLARATLRVVHVPDGQCRITPARHHRRETPGRLDIGRTGASAGRP